MEILTGHSRFVVKLDEAEKKKGGYIIPESGRKKPQQGIVVGKPEGYEGDLDIGDLAFIPQYAGTPVSYEGEEYIIASFHERSEEIVGYIKKKI